MSGDANVVPLCTANMHTAPFMCFGYCSGCGIAMESVQKSCTNGVSAHMCRHCGWQRDAWMEDQTVAAAAAAASVGTYRATGSRTLAAAAAAQCWSMHTPANGDLARTAAQSAPVDRRERASEYHMERDVLPSASGALQRAADQFHLGGDEESSAPELELDALDSWWDAPSAYIGGSSDEVFIAPGHGPPDESKRCGVADLLLDADKNGRIIRAEYIAVSGTELLLEIGAPLR